MDKMIIFGCFNDISVCLFVIITVEITWQVYGLSETLAKFKDC